MALQSKSQSRIPIMHCLWGEYHRMCLDNAKQGCSVIPVFSRVNKTKRVLRIATCDNNPMLNVAGCRPAQ
jgi:hypothetical protein